MKSRRLALVSLMFFATLTLILSAYLVKEQQQMRQAALAMESMPMEDGLPVIFDAPGFALTDQSGQSYTAEALEGHWWIADFMFTACQGACPIMTRAMQDIYLEFKGNSELHFVSFSVDPDNDTPDVLADFAKQYNADYDRWRFLTGPVETMHQLSYDGFKLGSLNDPTDHSTRFVLVDPQGRIRGFYDALDNADMTQLKEDLHAAL
jgi:cytochrome oxidase Cu insertion factor (SCO1/SenC/PrrC family)